MKTLFKLCSVCALLVLFALNFYSIYMIEVMNVRLPRCYGYGLGVVTSNMLAPTLVAGDAFLSYEGGAYESGDIILYQQRSNLTMGRVTDVDPDEGSIYIQDLENPISQTIVYGEAIVRLPGCGPLVPIFRSTLGLSLLLFAAVVIIKL